MAVPAQDGTHVHDEVTDSIGCRGDHQVHTQALACRLTLPVNQLVLHTLTGLRQPTPSHSAVEKCRPLRVLSAIVRLVRHLHTQLSPLLQLALLKRRQQNRVSPLRPSILLRLEHDYE